MNKIVGVEIKKEEWPNGHKIWRGIEVTDDVWERVESYVKYATEGLRNTVIENAIKKVVKEHSNPNHQSEWLARELAGKFNYVDDGVIRFDWAHFERVLKENGVPMVGKWVNLPRSGQPGWISAYQENGRERLEVEVARNRVLKFDGKEIMAPKEWINEMTEKHNRVLGFFGRYSSKERVIVKSGVLPHSPAARWLTTPGIDAQ